jgi:hypothetical protein
MSSTLRAGPGLHGEACARKIPVRWQLLQAAGGSTGGHERRTTGSSMRGVDVRFAVTAALDRRRHGGARSTGGEHGWVVATTFGHRGPRRGHGRAAVDHAAVR